MIEIVIFFILFLTVYFLFQIKDLFNPIYPLLLLWTIFISSFLRYSYLNIDIKADINAILVAFANIFILTVITAIGIFILKIQKNERAVIDSSSIYLPDNKHLSILILTFLIIFLIYIKVEFIHPNSGFLCPFYLSLKGKLKEIGIEKIHRFGKDSKLQLIISQLPIIGALFILYAKTYKSLLKKIILITLSLLVPLFGILKTSKSDIFFSIFLYLMVIYYTSPSKRKNLISACFIIILLALGIFITYDRVISLGGEYNKLIAYNIEKAPISIDPFIFGYTTANILNFFNFIASTNYTLISTDLLGLSFFRLIATLMLKGDYLDKLYSNIDLNFLGPGATVGTYMRTVYIEGGIILTFIASFIYATIVNFSYTKLLQNKTPKYLLIYSILYIPWFMLFFQNLFANLNIYFSIFLIWIYFKIIEESNTSN